MEFFYLYLLPFLIVILAAPKMLASFSERDRGYFHFPTKVILKDVIVALPFALIPFVNVVVTFATIGCYLVNLWSILPNDGIFGEELFKGKKTK